MSYTGSSKFLIYYVGDHKMTRDSGPHWSLVVLMIVAIGIFIIVLSLLVDLLLKIL